MNRDEIMPRADYPRVAMSQRLRRTLQQVRNRSRWGAVAIRRWRLLRQDEITNVEWHEGGRGGR